MQGAVESNASLRDSAFASSLHTQNIFHVQPDPVNIHTANCGFTNLKAMDCSFTNLKAMDFGVGLQQYL